MLDKVKQSIDIETFLSKSPFSKLQWRIFVITFLITFFDGYDTAIIGYIAPSLMNDLNIQKESLSTVLSAALFGLAFGAILLGSSADKFGRKKVLIFSVLLFAIGSILSAFVTTLTALEILRFITGIGLGAAMPNAITLLSEYCPAQKRATFVNAMFCGFALGASAGGFIAAQLIPLFGWQSTFILGGIFPFILAILMIFLIPESIKFLIIKESPPDIIKKILFKINPSANHYNQFYLTEHNHSNTKKYQLLSVLSRPFLLGTLMLFLTYFMGLVIFYGVINWMPTLFKTIHLSDKTASMITALFALGGIFSVLNGWLMDRFNGNILIASLYFCAMLAICLIGFSLEKSISLLVIAVLLAGIFVNTAQSSLPALASSFYPTEIRTTGVSLMLGIGRFGGITGSFLVAHLASLELSINAIFYILSLPALLAAFALLIKFYAYRN